MQNRSPHKSGDSKNSFCTVGIPLKKRLRCQAIHQAAPEIVEAGRNGPLRLNEHRFDRACHECRFPGIHVRQPRLTATGTKMHLTWTMYLVTRPVEVSSNSVNQTENQNRTWYLLSASRTHNFGHELFCWKQAQDCSPHTPGSIPLKKWHFRRWVITLVSPVKVRACGEERLS